MALTPSSMVPLGTRMPGFKLFNTIDDTMVDLADVRGSAGTLVMFICNHCPYVKHIQAGLSAVGKDYASSGLGIVAISANDVTSHPQDGPEKMRETAAANDYRFPYLCDATQEVARAYNAACTPDFFLLDQQDRLVYRGQFDASRPGNDIPVSGEDLRRAMDSLLAGETIDAEQIPSMGCNIKWKTG